MYRWYYFPFYLIRDIYWCFIPLNCRDCAFLERCRKGFFGGRKCYNGCIKINYAEKMKRKAKYQDEREDYIDNLLKYAEEQEQKRGGGKREIRP